MKSTDTKKPSLPFGWQVKTEPYGGFSLDIKKGKFKETDSKTTTLFQYRPTGSRGRWNRMVIVGKVPDDLQLLADTLDEQAKDARAKREAERKKSRRKSDKIEKLRSEKL